MSTEKTAMENTKKLGFGLMRLPRKALSIDIRQTSQMVDQFLAAGFTYFDTAHVYPGSEEAIRKALVERYPREDYTLATKLFAPSALTEEMVNEFALAVLSDINPRNSWRAGRAFRQHIAVEMAGRALIESIRKAGGEIK